MWAEALKSAPQCCRRWCARLRVRGDGDDRDLALAGAVAPEDAIGARGSVLGVCLEDLVALAVGVLERVELVGLKARVARVLAKQPDGLRDLVEQALLA